MSENSDSVGLSKGWPEAGTATALLACDMLEAGVFPTRVEALDSEAGYDVFEASIAILAIGWKRREPYGRVDIEGSWVTFSFTALPTTSNHRLVSGVGLNKAEEGLVDDKAGSRWFKIASRPCDKWL